MAHHTQLPWCKSKRTDAIIAKTVAELDEGTQKFYGGFLIGESIMPGNRDFILRVMNCHDELLAACLDALEDAEWQGRQDAPGVEPDWAKPMRAAVAKATEQETQP